jgi:P4 family phage/plasmid primase-like protien
VNELTAMPTPQRLKIQIRKLKDYTVPGSMKIETTDIPIRTGIEFTSVKEVLTTPWQEIYKSLDLTDVQDMFFTLSVAEDAMAPTRTWLLQKEMLFDCDKADYKRRFEYLDVFAEVSKLPRAFFSGTWTGGGLHILVSLKAPIDKKEFFSKEKVAYQIFLSKLTAECNKRKLPCNWDSDVFSSNRMSRLPGSTNSKYKSETAKVEILQENLIEVDFDLKKLAGIPELHKNEHISKKELAYYKIDKDTVLAGCEFLKYAKQNAKLLSEPEWFASLSILTRLPMGVELAHEYSKPHPDYSEDATNSKIHAIKTSTFGPRTCASIESMFPGCSDCKYKGLIKSPVQIKGDKFIATRESGFSIPSPTGKGFSYQHKDLLLHFESEAPFVYVPERKKTFRFDGKQWNPWHDAQVKEYAQNQFKPFARSEPINEFWNLISRTNVQPFADIFDSPKLIGRLNLQNGILDVENDTLIPHSPEFGFQDTRNYSFTPGALAPTFLKMISDVSSGDTQIQSILQEWFGYTVSGCEPSAQKMLICTGEGQNGKSKLLEILAALVGRERFFTTSFSSLQKEPTIANFENKDMLMFDEVPTKGDKATWEFLKSLASGSAITGAHKFEKAITFKMRAKIAMTCNTLPHGTDPTHGYFRRLLIIPFNATFSKDAGNLDSTIAERIIDTELPGVLNWALAGYKRLRANAWQFTDSKVLQDTLDEYKLNVDSLTRFFKDYLEMGEQTAGDPDLTCELEGKTYINTEELYKKYAQEVEDSGGHASGKTAFLSRLKVYLKSLAGGSWVKVESGDRDYELVGRGGQQIAVLTRRMVNSARKYLLQGVRIRGDLGQANH